MRCTSCDYSLWNLTARECPECGQSFRPSEFEFVPGSVQFCCPHCRQAYYGTSENGHLRPVEFDCVNCARHVHMDEMVLRPADGLEDRDTAVDDVPWLERKRLGFFKAWVITIWKSHIAPHRLMNAMPAHGATAQAWWFMLLTVFVATLAAIGWWMLLMVGFGLLMGGPMGGPGVGIGMFFTLFLAGNVLGSVILTAIFVAIWGLSVHGILRLTGTTHDSLRRTYSALCFSSGPIMLMAVPCLGMYVAMPWWIVAAVLMVYAAQRVSGWRATLAVVTLPLISWIVIIGAYFGMLFYAFPTMQGGVVTARTAAMSANVQSAILQSGAAIQGEGPRHVAELIDVYAISADRFILPGSFTQMTDTPVGDSNLYALSQAGPAEFERIVERAVADIPDNVIAYRLGDFVLTYPGIDFNTVGNELWIFITCADPDQNEAAAIDGVYTVAHARWGTEAIPASEFDQKLEEQNEVRERNGLPPLPHPWQIRHDRPAVAEPQDEPAPNGERD